MTNAADTITAGMDNAQFDPALVAAGEAILARDVTDWQRAGTFEQMQFQSRNDINDIADNVYAFTDFEGEAYWVLENDISGFPDPAQFVLVGFNSDLEVIALTHFDDWPDSWARPAIPKPRDPNQSLLDMAHKAAENSQSGPTTPKRLAVAGGMALLKGGVVSAIIIAPFFGIAAAVASATAFSAFCIGLALWRGPKPPQTT